MHHPSVFLTFLLLFSLNSCRAQSFAEHLDALMDEHGVMGMSAVVVCDGEIEAEYYGGLRNYENEWPVNSDTRYPALTQQTAPNFGRPGDALSSGFVCVWVDAMGKSVAETRAGDSVPALPPGMYLLRSADGGNLGRFQVQ